MTPHAIDDDECLDAVFDAAVATLANGEEPSDAALAVVPPHLRDAAADALRLARKVAFQRRPGRPLIAGYDVLDELGRGGMGIVYLARQQSLGRLVALKVLPPGAVASSVARARMVHEARALARVQHHGVVPVFDVIDAPEVCAFAMELIDGPSLAEVLRRLRVGGERSVSAWARAVCGEVLVGGSLVGAWCRSWVVSASWSRGHSARCIGPGWCIATSSHRTSCCGAMANPC